MQPAEVRLMQTLGALLRAARERAELSRDDVIARMPTGVSYQALANYEYGIRPLTVMRLIEICNAVGVSALDVLALALQREAMQRDD